MRPVIRRQHLCPCDTDCIAIALDWALCRVIYFAVLLLLDYRQHCDGTLLHRNRCGLLLQTEWRGLSVCLSVCLSVGLSVTVVSSVKTAEPIKMPFGLRIRVVDASYCYRPSRVVCLSVCLSVSLSVTWACLSVCYSSKPCKNGWTNQDRCGFGWNRRTAICYCALTTCHYCYM